MNKRLILIVDDEQRLVRSMQMVLEPEGYSIAKAYTGQEGINKALELEPDLILLDLRLPDLSGIDLLKQLRQRHIAIPVIMLSAHGDIKVAVEAVKSGAFDFISKPFDLNELKLLILRCLERQRLDSEVSFYRQRASSSSLIGQSEGMVRLQDQIARVAGSSAKTILLLGPSGTGKTAIAREIHNLSGFAEGPFIEVNCASLPEQLLEAELFGAEKGAYTGADKKRSGLVELASDGTLFLDEIGEVSLAIQAKLLTFLENHSYRPVGAGREHKANVRVIAATNLDLGAAVQDGSFRSDLYYRLNVMPIDVPSLQERRQDIPLLLEYFALTMAANEGSAPVLMSGEIVSMLQGYSWSGNIRELKNLMERLTILYPGEDIAPDMLPPEMQSVAEASSHIESAQSGSVTIENQLASKEKSIILQALDDAGGRKGLAAEKLGISRHAFKRRLQKLGID
ncbi:MAG: sigma-54 dependent transcriptional regulator [Amphritea sp.]